MPHCCRFSDQRVRMTWHWISASLWQRLLVALLIVVAASAFRVVFFDVLGCGIPISREQS
jgi:hypothetical protein